tara:strand:- start:1434 stop:2366 length:933 start_codon:yes stop_codon:yes gene_type:complete
MFSVIFPGQGSQFVGMTKDLYDKFDLIKKLYRRADQILNSPLTKIILEGPEEELKSTENTQPAIFLVSYGIFKLSVNEFGLNLNKANYFAGHSLGEYSALSCSGSLDFEDALRILKIRGRAMQNSVPENKGGMIAIIGSSLEIIQKIIDENKNKFKCYIANDNSNQQIVVSGLNSELDLLSDVLNHNKIKNIRLAVSAPFHCKLMQPATIALKSELQNIKFKNFENKIISNVTAKEVDNPEDLKNLLINQIESKVRWRESINYIISNKVNKFIEIGPGKILSNLVKRIDKTVKVSAINNEEDINELLKND